MNCSLCEREIVKEVQGFSEFPCNHRFHLRCMIVACENYWGTNEICCRICKASPNQQTSESAFINLENTLTVEEAYVFSEDRFRENKTKRLEDKIKTMTDNDKEVWKTYVDLCKNVLTISKEINVIAKRSARQFHEENEHLVSLYNKSFRKAYKELLNDPKYKNYNKLKSKLIRHFDALHQFSAEYLEPFNLSADEFAVKLGLITTEADINISKIDLFDKHRYMYHYAQKSDFYDIKNIFRSSIQSPTLM